MRISGFLDPRIIRWASCKYVSNKDKALVMQRLHSQKGSTAVSTVGAWARFRCGLYKNDVGYVWKVLGPDFIQIAVIPRLWDQSISTLKRKLDGNGREMKRAPQMVLSNDVIGSVDTNLIKPGPDESTFRLGNEVYLKLGLRLVDVYAIHAVMAVDPDASEVSVFTELHLNTRRITNKAFLSIGDTVDIVSGNVCGCSGTVKSISNSGLCSIEATEPRYRQITTYMATLDDIDRRFEPGVTVIVQLGPFSGRSGYVVAASSDTLTIVDNLSMLEVCDVLLQVCSIHIPPHSL